VSIELKIGVDGGGSKTECVLVDQRGDVVARHLAAGCNPSVVGVDQARLIVTDALCALLAEAKRQGAGRVISQTLLCMAGSRSFWHEFATTLGDFGHVTAVDDSLPILELATRGDPGLVLHAGTGSFVAARAPDGSLHYAGGLGWRFGDAGSAYDIGQRVIGRALLELQGWAAPTRFAATVRDHAQLAPNADAGEVTRFFYHHPEPNRLVAGLGPAIMRLANEGDAPAQAVVTESAGELVALATKVAAKLFRGIPLDTIPAGLSGPILTVPVIVEAITPKTPLPLTPIDGAPIEGVRRLLAKKTDKGESLNS
jgi:glucosamine kinase